MNKKVAWLVTLLFFAISTFVGAQQPKIPRVGYLAGFGNAKNPGAPIEAFQQGLQNLGYVEGKNITVEYRYIEGIRERVAPLVSELVQLKPNVLVIPDAGAIRAAKQATQTIPIVMITTVDPVKSGFIDSLARPGGNITGLSRLIRELGGKRLELLKEVVPKLIRVAVLYAADDEGSTTGYREYQAAAHVLQIQLQSFELRAPNLDLDTAFPSMAKGGANARIVIRGPLVRRHTKQIVNLAIKYHLPCMCEGTDTVEAGGLMSYSTSDTDDFRRAAVYVDKILKGTKPADLPVEQPTKFEFIINLKTAKQIGLAIPPNVLARADKVIR